MTDTSKAVPAHSKQDLARLSSELLDENLPLPHRYRALFTLRNIATEDAAEALERALFPANRTDEESSALLRHEVAYALGQCGKKRSIAALQKVLADAEENSMVRHEAGEALGAIGDESAIPILQEYCTSELPEIAETCILSIERIKWLKENQQRSNDVVTLPATSVDPAPPLPSDVPLQKLREILLDSSESLFQRYRALFALREKEGSERSQAATIIAEALDQPGEGALFRHELAFVLGQLGQPEASEALLRALEDLSAHDMVRHEAAEALGAIIGAKYHEPTVKALKEHLKSPIRVIRESAQVALDVLEHNASDEFQYADGLK